MTMNIIIVLVDNFYIVKTIKMNKLYIDHDHKTIYRLNDKSKLFEVQPIDKGRVYLDMPRFKVALDMPHISQNERLRLITIKDFLEYNDF